MHGHVSWFPEETEGFVLLFRLKMKVLRWQRFDNVFFGRMISQRNWRVRCSFLIKTILTVTIAVKCKFSKHVPLLALYKHLGISARALCIQNMLTWECLRPRSYVKHRMRRTHSIDLSPDQAPKPSYIKQVITRQAGFIRRLSSPHWYFLAFAGDRPAIDDATEGRCRIRLMPSSILQNEKFGQASSRGDVVI